MLRKMINKLTKDRETTSPPSNPTAETSSPPTTREDFLRANTSSPIIKFEDLQIHRTLGTGSFGRVQLVYHSPSRQFMAMKKMRKSDIIRLRQVEHTNMERFLLAQVHHPFIVRLLTTHQDARHLYLIMELVQGGELFGLLRRVKTLPPFVACFYAAEVCLALEHLHSRNIIYRDLKPENLLIDADGHVKLTDFGFAKIVPDLTWTMCGTPDYLAPEIVQRRGYGILIYEMLIGAPPFYSDNQAKLYDNIVTAPPRFPLGFDPVARNLIEGLLEKDPVRRLGSSTNGAMDIQRHPWFREVDWAAIQSRSIKAPYRPKITGEGDASNFDQYPDEQPEMYTFDEAAYKDAFPGF